MSTLGVEIAVDLKEGFDDSVVFGYNCVGFHFLLFINPEKPNNLKFIYQFQ